MNKKLLKAIAAIVMLLVLENGCKLPGVKNGTSERYKQVIALQNRAHFLRREGVTDSAIAYYKKSRALCFTIVKQSDSAKDTVYRRKITFLDNLIGFIYDSVNATHENSTASLYDSALTYSMESLKWAKLSNTLNYAVKDNYLMGYIYYNYAVSYENGSDERKNLFEKGIIHFRAGLRMADSLGIPRDKYSLKHYLYLRLMYTYMGDTANYRFFHAMYDDLYFKLRGYMPPK